MLGLLFSKLGGVLVLVTACLIALAVVSRNWSCRDESRKRKDRPHPIETYGPWEVVSVDGGCCVTCRFGRKDRRECRITLAGIAIPPAGELADKSRQTLELLIGGSGGSSGETITIDAPRTIRTPDALEGVVRTSTGMIAQVGMLRAGVAWIVEDSTTTTPADWKAAEKAAKADRWGVWADKKTWPKWANGDDTVEP